MKPLSEYTREELEAELDRRTLLDEEKYNDAIRGLQSTDDPRLVRLHDRLVWELGVLREGKARSGRD